MKKRIIALALSALMLLSMIPLQALANMIIIPFPDEDNTGIIKPWYPNADGGLGYNSTEASGEAIFNAMLEQSKSGEPDSFDDDTLTPYATQKGEAFTMLEKLELFNYIANGNELKSAKVLDDMSYANNSAFLTAKNQQSISNIGGLRFARGVAFDPTGCGQRNHVAIIGFQDDGTNTSGKRIASFHLYIINAENKVVVKHESFYSCSSDRYGNLINALTIVDSSNLIQITAGDYNGDGRDSIVLYDSIGLYEVSNPTNSFQTKRIDNTSKGKSYCNDAYKNSNLSSSWQLRNQLCMALTSADVNGDGIDDFVALSYTGDISTDYVSAVSNKTCIPQLSVGYGKKGASSVSELSIDKASVGTKTDSTTTKTLACPGVAIGDIDGDGKNEIIAAGFTNQSKTNDVVIVADDKNANPVAYAYYESSGAGKLKSISGIKELPRANTSYIAKDDSLRESEYLFQQLSVECVALDGMHTKEYVFLSGWFYYLSSSGELQSVAGNTRDECDETGAQSLFFHLEDGYKVSGKNYDVDEVFVLSASVGNYFPKDEKDNGREGIAVVVGYKTHTDANAEGDYNFREAVYWGDDRATGTNKLTSFACVDLPMIQYGLEGDAEFLGFKDVTRGDAGIVLCGVDVGTDSVVAKYSGKAYTYTDPTVVAFLQAAPYFSELGAGNSSTQYSYSEGYRVTEGSSTEVSFNVGFSAEFEAGPVKSSMEAGVAFELNEEFVKSIDKTYTTTFEANDQNQIILRQTLMYYYAYDVGVYDKATGQIKFVPNALIVSAPQYPVLTSVSMDQYNELAAAYNKKVDASTDNKVKKEHKMALITDALKEYYFLNNEGNPFAYASEASKYAYNGIPGWDLSQAKVGDTDTWMKLSYAGGTQSQAYSVTLEEEKTKSVAEGCFANMTIMAGGGIGSFSAYAGVTAGFERLKGNSFSKASMTATETSGTVQNLTSDLTDYGFNWKLIGWKTDDLFPGVPFVGYAVKDQKDLPKAVDDLKAFYSKGKVTLTFTAPTAEPGRMAATYFYAYDDQHDHYIGACSNSSTDPNRSITIDVSGYTTQSATFTVIPFNETKNMRGMPSNEAFCLFVMSDKDINALVQELRDSIAALKTALEGEDADLADAIAELVAAYEALSAEIEDLEDVQAALSDTMAKADAALQAAIDKVNADLSAAIKKLSQDTDKSLEKAITDLTDAYTAADALLKADIDTLSGKLDDLKNTTSDADKALQEAIDEVKEELSAAIENLRQASDEALVKAIDDLTVAYTSADALLKADIDSLSDKLSTLEQTMNEADDALQEAIDKVKEELSAAIENLRQASDEALVKAIDDLTVAYTSADALLKADIDSLSEKLTALGQTMGEAYDVLLATIEQVQDDLDATKKELENAIAEDMAQLNNKIDTMNAALDAAYKLADEMLKKDIEALLDKLQAVHNKDIDALRAELEADYKADIDALRAELEALKVQISEQDDTNSDAIQTLKSVDSTQKEATDIFRNITIVGLCIGSVSLLGNAILLILQLKKKYLK